MATMRPFVSDTVDYQFDALGRRSIAWRESLNFGIRDSYYWGSTPIAYHAFDGTTYYQQQDWERTERVRTDAQGNTVASYFTLPFGDGFWDSSSSDERRTTSPGPNATGKATPTTRYSGSTRMCWAAG